MTFLSISRSPKENEDTQGTEYNDRKTLKQFWMNKFHVRTIQRTLPRGRDVERRPEITDMIPEKNACSMQSKAM